MYLSRFLFHLSRFFLFFFVFLFEKKQRKKQFAFLFGIWLTRSLSRNSNKLFTVNHRNFRGKAKKKKIQEKVDSRISARLLYTISVMARKNSLTKWKNILTNVCFVRLFWLVINCCYTYLRIER